jgi:D-arginine dehydrogenase
MSTPTFDLVIVGAGIAGVSLAYHLPAHWRVLVLEQESQPAYHTTGRSAAMFMQAYGPSGVRALTRASRAFFSQPPTGFATTALMQDRGSLVLGFTGQEAQLQHELDTLRADNPALAYWSAAQCVELVPALRIEGLVGGVMDDDAKELEVHALHQGFLRGAQAKGFTLRCNETLATAQRISPQSPSAAQSTGHWQISLQSGQAITTRAIANAAGAWGDVVAQACGAPPQHLTPKRRSAFTFTAPAHHTPQHWPLVSAVDESFYFKPDAGQLLGSPANADPVPPHDVVPEELDIAIGIAGIEAVTNLTIRRPNRTWAGLRTFAPSGEPVIGWDPDVPGFFWLVGQGGYGIQTSPAAGLLAATLVQQGVENVPLPLPRSLLDQGLQADTFKPVNH